MPGLFQGLEIGRRALLTNQIMLQTIGHNIANVNTPGYSRQRVNIRTSFPENSTIGSIGSGVEVGDIRHIRDLFLGDQFRQESKSLGEWSYKEKVLDQMQGLFGEPKDNAFSASLDKFWDAWSEFSTQPDSGTRETLISQTGQLTKGFHELANNLNKLRNSINSDLTNYTSEINRMTSQIAKLNHQIQSLEVGGVKANDLRDQRDIILDELSSMVDINSNENQTGEMIVYIGAMSIVNGSDSLNIESRSVNENGIPTYKLVWEGTDVELKNSAGQLAALLESRDEIIPAYIERLNKLASTIVEEVNNLHMSGSTSAASGSQTGIPFFDTNFTDAFNIQINQTLVTNSDLIISGAGESSDNRIAKSISELIDKGVFNNNTTTFSQFYGSMIGKVAVEANEAISFSNNYELLVQQIDFSRQSVQGVSLDEEMTNMIKFQHAYDAAARVITTMDQALDTVIRGMGIVGR